MTTIGEQLGVKKSRAYHSWTDEEKETLVRHYDLYAERRKIYEFKAKYFPREQYPEMKLQSLRAKANSMKNSGEWNRIEAKLRGAECFEAEPIGGKEVQYVPSKHTRCRSCNKKSVCMIWRDVMDIQEHYSAQNKTDKVLELGASRCPWWQEEQSG